MKLTTTLNGEKTTFTIQGNEILLDVLRDHGLFGTKRGCDNGDCGACTVMVDDVPICSCIYLAGLAEGREVTTIEALGTMEDPHPLQTAFVDCAGIQCGFCIPGILISAKAMLAEIPEPTVQQMKDWLGGNLCRCTGYTKQFEAIAQAAEKMRTQGDQQRSSGERGRP